MKCKCPTQRPNARDPTQTYIPLAPRYQHVGIPNAKFWCRGNCPTPTPNARYFASQWNIGVKGRVTQHNKIALDKKHLIHLL